ncbi:MAG: plasmid pRiA4b ORF-3 family protein [Candidatus Moraniibacteriota bacterium]
MEKSTISKNSEKDALRIRNIKKMGHGKGGITVEIDYFRTSQWFKDDAGRPFHPLIILFVHRESYFILDANISKPSPEFLDDFFDRFLQILEKSPAGIGKILVKKRDLFDSFEKSATDLNIGIELIKRLPSVESVKGSMTKVFNTETGREKPKQKNTAKKKAFRNVYQFKILLAGSKPPIWRRILVPEKYSFWDLHVAIQDAMGWMDCHLHEFQTIRKNHGDERTIGIPNPDNDDDDIEPGWNEMISDVFPEEIKMRYVYDFGDYWVHSVALEKILPKEVGVEYPICTAGRMACPFEDSGALWGYYDMLEILKHPKHPEYKDTVEWIGDDQYDPEEFDLKEVSFSDPKQRLEELFGSGYGS